MKRFNDPKSYIDWLKTTPAFKHGELDNLPLSCVILHDSLILEHLNSLGYNFRNYKLNKIGATDPIEFYIVYEGKSDFSFIIMSGLPGSGGISTQVCEMAALGCKYFFHIGTCGLIGDIPDKDEIIVSQGSYKDQAAEMLGSSSDKVSMPDKKYLNTFINFLNSTKIKFKAGLGVTIPIFYFQPEDFLRKFITDTSYQFIEMEEASFFESCNIMGANGVSVVFGSDFYSIKNGEITHEFLDIDSDNLKRQSLKICINFFRTTYSGY
jgi:purine-nucleoside phosphorylase